ncbi:glycosyltransferase family 2 protein [Marinobacter sp.]|uniref:glycosyltransferase family 2 protein n=1 Tax=Marinobacter sp. TaxID=50741 RepID=UPI003F98DC06
MSVSITFCIFSFNRGGFLKNCIDSIESAVDQPEIVVFDDDSDDPQTLEYLSDIVSRHQIVRPEKKGSIKHGGLYHNMQNALVKLKDRDLLCFLQDDTQLVRPLLSGEVAAFNDLLEKSPDTAFIHPCFIRGVDQLKRPLIPEPGPDGTVFLRKNMGQSAGVHYSDLVMFKPARLLRAGWEFKQSEPGNDAQAADAFGAMLYLWAPYAMWLPEVPAYRGKSKTLGLKLAEKRKNCGFYPFQMWSEAQAMTFLAEGSSRDREPPIAENYLECVGGTPSKPWTYNPLTGYSLLKHLNNIEVALRRWLLLARK